MTNQSGSAATFERTRRRETPERRRKWKNVPFRCFPELKFFWTNGSFSWTEGNGGTWGKKKIFCALKTPELPSKAVLQRTDFILIQLLQSPAACAPKKKELYCFSSAVTWTPVSLNAQNIFGQLRKVVEVELVCNWKKVATKKKRTSEVLRGFSWFETFLHLIAENTVKKISRISC